MFLVVPLVPVHQVCLDLQNFQLVLSLLPLFQVAPIRIVQSREKYVVIEFETDGGSS